MRDGDRRRYVDPLAEEFPLLFKEYPRCGISYCDGWKKLLQDLCQGLTELIEASPGESLHVIQIKEKFGSLRFYYSTSGVSQDLSDEIRTRVNEAERLSCVTCEMCGGTGSETKINNSWVATLCVDCAIKRRAEQEA